MDHFMQIFCQKCKKHKKKNPQTDIKYYAKYYGAKKWNPKLDKTHKKNAPFWDIKSNVLCLYLYVLRVGGDGGVIISMHNIHPY